MIALKFNSPRYYVRQDPDAGWTMAFWKWRVFFNIVDHNPRK